MTRDAGRPVARLPDDELISAARLAPFAHDGDGLGRRPPNP